MWGPLTQHHDEPHEVATRASVIMSGVGSNFCWLQLDEPLTTSATHFIPEKHHKYRELITVSQRCQIVDIAAFGHALRYRSVTLRDGKA
jgi:hypothetical protein